MHNKDIKNSFFDYSSLVGSNIGIILLSFISIPILVRILGASEYGKLNLFFMICQITFVTMVGWTFTAGVRFGKEEFMKSGKVNETFWARAALSFPFYMAAIALFILFRAPIARYVGFNGSNTTWLFIVYVGLFWLINSFHNVFKATSRMKLYASMEIVERLIFVLILVVVFLTKSPVSLIIAVMIYLAKQIAVIVYFLCVNKLKVFYPVTIKAPLIKSLLTYSAPLFMVAVSIIVMGWVDIFVIKLFLGTREVGLYSLSYKLIEYLRMLSTHTATIILPILISFYVAKKEPLIKDYVKRDIPQMAFFWALFISVVMMALYFSFDFIFGKEFDFAIDSFMILALGLSVFILFSLHRPIIHVYKLTSRIFFITLAALAVNVILDFVLVPLLGINGAALATVCSIFVIAVLQMRVTSRHLKLKVAGQFLPCLIVMITFIAFQVLKPKGIWAAFPVILIFCASILFAKLSGIFKKSDMDILDKINMPSGLKNTMKKVIGALA